MRLNNMVFDFGYLYCMTMQFDIKDLNQINMSRMRVCFL